MASKKNSTTRTVQKPKERFAFNLNDFMYVKLTARGVLVYRAHYGCAPDRDKDGYCKFQMWEFSYIFGSFVSIGFDVICKPDFYIERWI